MKMYVLKFWFRTGILLISLMLLTAGCGEQKEKTKEEIEDIIFAKPDPVEFKGFAFVGSYKQKASLYWLDMNSLNFKEIWTDEKDKVYELTYSPELSACFFITARKFGRRGQFPFIEKVKLFMLDQETRKAKQLKDLGSGMQIFTVWEDENSLRIAFNDIDITYATIINQHNLVLNERGAVLLEEDKAYDLTIDGYPVLLQPKSRLYPESRMFELLVNESVETEISLRYSRTEPPLRITSTPHKLKQVEWSSDSKFLVFSTISEKEGLKNTNSYSSIYVYSLKEREIIKQWDGTGLKNFFLVNDLLIFDTGFGSNSQIIIYDFEKEKELKKINVRGGCGLKNIPFLL